MKVPDGFQPLLVSADQASGWFALLFTHDSVTAQVDAVLRERHQLSFSAVEVMCQLSSSEPQPVRALADQMVSVSPTRVSRLVQELIDAGYLQRSADQRDGRISLISFTEAGRRYAQEVELTFEEAAKKYFLDYLDSDDIAALIRIREKLEQADRSRF